MANNAAEGLVRQREAAAQAAAVACSEKERQIASEAVVSCAAIRAAYARLARTRASVDSYRRALANEEENRRLGMSTQFNVMQMEDLLVEAMSDEVDAVLNCASAVLRLRAATGTLVRGGEDGSDSFSVALDDLLTVPPAE